MDASASCVEDIIASLPSLYQLNLFGELPSSKVSDLTEAINRTRCDSEYFRLDSADVGNNRLEDAGLAPLLPALLGLAPSRHGDLSEQRQKSFAQWPGVRLLGLSWNAAGAATCRRLGEILAEGGGRALQQLDLECNYLGDAGAAAVAEFLPGAVSLRVLRLGGNNIGAAGGKALGLALRQVISGGASRLEDFDLSRNFIGTSVMVMLWAQAVACDVDSKLGQPPLKRLRLDVNRIHDVGAQAMAASLAKTSSCGVHMEVLDLGFNLIGDAGALAMANAIGQGDIRVSRLSVCGNRFSAVGIDGLADACERGTCSSLRSLDLEGCDASLGTAAPRIAAALRRNQCSLVLYDPIAAGIEMCAAGAYGLDLSGLHIGTGGLDRLAAAICSPRARLASLAVARAGIGDQGVARLTEAIASSVSQHCLVSLDLGWNNIGPQGAKALAQFLQSPKSAALSSLQLECNCLGDEGAASLGTSLGALRRLGLASNTLGPAGALALLSERPQLEELLLGCNRLGQTGVGYVATFLRDSRLARLDLSVNRLKCAAVEALATALTCRQQGVPLALDLRSNFLAAAAACALAVALAQGCISELLLEHNSICGIGAQALMRALAECKSRGTCPSVLGLKDAEA